MTNNLSTFVLFTICIMYYSIIFRLPAKFINIDLNNISEMIKLFY